MANLSVLTDAMAAVLRTRTREEWMTVFDAAGVPVGPVHTIAEALNHPQVRARGMVVEVDHPQAGKTRSLGCPLHFSATPTSVRRHAPMLGEHSRELLREYGYGDAEIDALAAEGVIEEADID
jgi:crotonobetainyl-CoA:carnitine CoA-transferase CaiB-like acyl-CoA transferase